MRLRYTLRARRSLGAIVGYYVELGRAGVGLAITSRLRARARELMRHPLLGPVEPALAHREDREYRSLVVGGNYKLVYFVAGESVTIADVFDVRRDPGAMLG